jgi:hypothetical protein
MGIASSAMRGIHEESLSAAATTTPAVITAKAAAAISFRRLGAAPHRPGRSNASVSIICESGAQGILSVIIRVNIAIISIDLSQCIVFDVATLGNIRLSFANRYS